MTEPFEQLRLAIRSLGRTPAFAMTAVLTLALGIGLSTAVFTIADAVLIRRLPVANQDRLVLLWGKTRDGRMPNVPMTVNDVRTIERKSVTLEAVAFFPFRGASSAPMRVGDRVFPVQLAFVSGNYFAVLGARAALGRPLRAEDDVVGAHPVMVLSHRAWQERFGGDSAVIGRSITMVQDGRSHTIVGVMPPELEYPRTSEVWAPIIAYSSAAGFHDIIVNEVNILARLRPGASPSQARSEMSSYFARADAPRWHRNVDGVVHSFSAEVLGDTRPALLLIAFAAALLLFIACVNVANLLLIRALGRAKELVVRSALGASRGRMLAPSLSESALLSLAGGLLGIAFAVATVRTFVAFAPNHPRFEGIAVNETTLVAAIVVTLLAVLVSGTGPALFTVRLDANQMLRSGTRTTGSRRVRLVLEGLVVAQIALAVICLTAAGLMGRSFIRLANADLSFRSDNLLVAPLTVATTELPDGARVRAALDLVVQRLRTMPHVQAVSLTYSPPFIGGGGGIDGRLAPPRESGNERSNPWLNLEIATPEYFSTLGIPVLRGRAFGDDDREGSQRVVIVSASVARHYWPGQDPIGKKLVASHGEVTVVGVVPDTRYRDLRTARWSAYFPLRQSAFGQMSPTTLVIRTPDSPATLLPGLRRAIEETSPGVALTTLTSVEAMLAGPRTNARLNTMVLAFFAIAAVSLAALGLFAIIATMVRQRTHELGIRLALGATARDVGSLVVRRGVSLTLIGAGVGVAAAFAASQVLSALLFDLQPTDVPTLAGVAALMLVVAVLASFLPARWSTRIDPVIALRSEA